MRNMIKRWQRLAQGLLIFLFISLMGVVYAEVNGPKAVEESTQVETVRETITSQTKSWIAISVAITMGVACLAAGIAVGKVGTAALGAAAEKPELMGRALLFVGLAEGIAIYGLIIALFLIRKL